jgi:hypothetical protein
MYDRRYLVNVLEASEGQISLAHHLLRETPKFVWLTKDTSSCYHGNARIKLTL